MMIMINISAMVSLLILLHLLFLPWNIFGMNFKNTCEQLKLPRECQCQFNRPLTIHSFNETRLRCRQLTDIKNNYHWSKISYDRLIFETSNENLTLHRSVFAELIVRSLQFHVPNLFLHAHAFDYASIGQLVIFNARIDFQTNSEIFSGTTITNLYFKSTDFQYPISEWIFFKAKIHLFLIESSKFYGFTNANQPLMSKLKSNIEDYLLPNETEQTVIMNITSSSSLTFISICTIISSINTTLLTENYFSNNFDYKQMEEIELIFNQINALDRYVFRHLKEFHGRLILHNNQIQFMHVQTFDYLFHLKNLSLAKNVLSHLSNRHFQDLKQLIELDLSFNQFKQFDNMTFQHLIHLERLYLNNNPIEYLHPDTFTHLIKLKEIYFQGIPFLQWIIRQDIQWLWNLANLHIPYLMKTDFELSDVAFCILSRYNQSLFHLSRQHTCSCLIHYFNFNINSTWNDSSIIQLKYPTNYLRLTPLCQLNETNSIFEERLKNNDLILRTLENQCDYQLTFIDCDAMTTTTTSTTTTITTETEQTNTKFPLEITDQFDSSIRLTTTTLISLIPSKSLIKILTHNKSLNNIRKLFTVLATLIIMTIFAIFLVFMWYRCQTMIKRRRKRRSLVEQSKHFNSPAFQNHSSMTIRYASSDMSGSVYSGHFSSGKSQSDALIDTSGLNTYKHLGTLENDLVKNFIEEENLPVDSTTVNK